ncbi:hypothetical protein [Halopenitus sp. POP-27]|uniref:hypothetical protein n=1 Tax=Halopenitus sp. POP-27 TaxID=2994425 RepID=UPI002468E830|nr:hypothetical protein [Halopenitus sp. POP-27]
MDALGGDRTRSGVRETGLTPSDRRDDDRAQSVQIGAVLLFGFLIVSISVMQATVVPDQNRQVEFSAYQQAAADLTDVRNDVLEAAGRDTTAGTTVKTGVEYPNRLLFVNPGPPPNRIETTDERTVAIENIKAVDSEPANVQAFVGSNVSGSTYTTRDLRFDPNYNVLDGQPMVVTGQEAYRVTGSGPLPLASQTLIGGENGERIHLTTVDGNLATGGSSVPITADSVSTSTQSVGVQSADDGDITIRMMAPSGISADGWVDRTGNALVTRYDRVLAADNVTAAGDDAERVALTLNGSADLTYQLKLSRVEVRSTDTSTTVPDPDPAYITASAGDDQSVVSGQRALVSASVRDDYTNPVAGTPVEFAVTDGGATLVNASGADVGTPHPVTTTDDGTASIRVDTTGVTSDVEVTATAIDATSAFDETTFDVQVADESGSAPDPEAGPSSSIRAGSATATNPLSVSVPLENPTNETATIRAIGFRSYTAEPRTGNGQGVGNQPEMSPVELTLDETTQTFEIPGSLETLDSPIAVQPSGTDFELEFNESPVSGDFFVVSVQFEDGVTRTFFVDVE